MSYMFSTCLSLEKLDVKNFDTSSVTAMKGMFNYCRALKILDISNLFVINDNTNYQDIFFNIYSNIKIKTTRNTADKLINNTDLTSSNFEIIE